MSANRTIRPPHFLDETAPPGPPSPLTFPRMPSPRAGAEPALRVVPAPVRPPPTPPPADPPQSPPPAPAPPPASEGPPPAETLAPPPSAPTQAAVLAGLLRPPPTTPGPTPAAPEATPPDVLRRLEAAVQRLKLEAARLADQARADALEIGFQVARRILEQELTTSPEPLFALVRSAVRRLGDARRLVIRLNPADAARLDTSDGRQKLGLSLMQVELVSDPSLEPGDCVVESDQATVDGRLSTRLDEVRRGLAAALSEQETER